MSTSESKPIARVFTPPAGQGADTPASSPGKLHEQTHTVRFLTVKEEGDGYGVFYSDPEVQVEDVFYPFIPSIQQDEALIWSYDEGQEPKVWGSTQYILEKHVRNLVDRLFGHGWGTHGCLVRTANGAFNRVWIIRCHDGSETTMDVVVRVPFAGNKDRWTLADAQAMISSACTMHYISGTAKGIPVAEILALETDHTNESGHPYVVTTSVAGKNFWKLWNATGEENDEEEVLLEKTRQRLLGSLAKRMTELKARLLHASACCTQRRPHSAVTRRLGVALSATKAKEATKTGAYDTRFLFFQLIPASKHTTQRS